MNWYIFSSYAYDKSAGKIQIPVQRQLNFGLVFDLWVFCTHFDLFLSDNVSTQGVGSEMPNLWQWHIYSSSLYKRKMPKWEMGSTAVEILKTAGVKVLMELFAD